MILWCDDPYLDEVLTPGFHRLKKKIAHEKLTMGIYCIAFPTNPNNLFDIIPANELLFPYYKKREMRLVGAAKGKQSAFLLLAEMLEDMLQELGTINPKEYFSFPETMEHPE